MIEILLILGILFVRLLPRLLRQDKTDADTWYHISSVKSIVNNKYKIPKCNDGFVLGGKYDYPYFAHWIVSLFVKDEILKFERFINPIIDTVYITTGALYFYFLLSYYEISIENKIINYLLLLVFSTTMLKISTGPRVYSYTPRVFGEYFIFIFFIGLHIYLLTDNIYFLLLSSIFGGLSLNTSTFASQVMSLFSVLLAIFLDSFIPIALFLFSIILALFFSKGHYFYILSQQLKFSFNYATYGQFHHPSVKNRNHIKQYVKFFEYILKFNLKEAYIVFIRDLTFFNILYKNFEVIIAISILFMLPIDDKFIIYIFLTAFIIFIITSFRPFLFLGESDRYLEYIVIFSAIVLSLSLSEKYIILIVCIEIVAYLLTLLLYMKSSNNYGQEYLSAMRYIENNIKHKDDYIIHAIMHTYINYSLTPLSRIRSLTIEANYAHDIMKDKELMPINLIYTNDFDYLYSKYGVNIIVANKKYLNKNIKYDFSKFNLFYENKQYVVYVRKEI